MGGVNCFNSNIRRIIFLDIDGVLHTNNTPQFSNLEIFERYLHKMPDVEIALVQHGGMTTPLVG